MKRTVKLSSGLLALPVMILLLFGCAGELEEEQNLNKDLSIYELKELSLVEPAVEDMLIYLVEEEKLAHDVYFAFKDPYAKVRAFEKITDSETNHVAKVRWLMDRLEIEDPSSDVPGEFMNQELDALYKELLDQGSESIKKALMVGAYIEEFDIFDLDEYMLLTDDEVILDVLEYLACGSRNHLRAFDQQLDKRGVTYIAEVIDPILYDAIAESPREECSMAD